MNPIYKPKGRAEEYCGLALNIYTGCTHGCTYCYAAKNAKRWGRDFSLCEPRSDIVEQTRAQLDRGTIKGQMIHLCFTCDPYPSGIDTSSTRLIIKAIKDSGNHVQILTKGGTNVMRDFDLLDAGDWFGVTITGRDDLEPNAAPNAERYAVLKEAHALGLITWVSFEPVFSPELVYEYIANATAIDRLKIGKLNHARSDVDWAAFGQECERLCKEYNLDYYLKEDLRTAMESTGELI